MGYTNAGKSSLVNALTGSGVLVQDALFATLDPTTRRAKLDDGRVVVFTDTVGFVRHLPTQLVEAFRSTLEEAADADLLLHVVDGADEYPLGQISAVRQVLAEIVSESSGGSDTGASGAALPPELVVVNKVDAMTSTQITALRGALPDAVFISARTGEGLPELFDRIRAELGGNDIELFVSVPFSRGDLVSRIHAEGEVLATDHDATGTRMRVRVPVALAGELSELVVGG